MKKLKFKDSVVNVFQFTVLATIFIVSIFYYASLADSNSSVSSNTNDHVEVVVKN